MLERALPARHLPIADKSAIRGGADAVAQLRDIRHRLLRLLRILGDFIAMG